MNKFQKILSIFTNPIFKRIPDSKTIDRTGIVKSDHPKVGNGWMKGWVVDVEPKNIVIICAHAGPSLFAPNNKVFVTDEKGKKHERTIIAVDRVPFKIFEGESRYDFDYYNGGDIAICKLDSPLPKNIKGYKIAKSLDVYAQKTVTFDQDGNESIAQIRYEDDIAWIRGKKRWGNLLIAGDSGMPWFVWEDKEWRILTHTHRGQWGEGPWYAHPFIINDLKNRITNLQH